MITATIKNGEKSTEITFPCKEHLLAKALDGIGIDGKQYAPTLLITEIEPKELSMLENEMTNLDELNYLAKQMNNFSQYEMERFLAAASYETQMKSRICKMLSILR